MSKEKKKPSIEYDYDETYVMCNQYVWCVIHMYMGGDFVMESTEVFDFAESMKSQINVHTGTLYISCIPIIYVYISVCSITRPLFLTLKTLISLLNNIYLTYEKLVSDIN